MNTSSSIAIQTQNISKRFKKQQALDDVSFQVHAGEIFALIGGNGAGKSTLIKILLDFISADQGSALLFDTPSTLAKSRTPLVYLPERFMPPAWMRAGRYVHTFSKLYGTQLPKEQLHQACQMLYLDVAALKKPIRKLSKGMTQKIGLLSVFLSNKPLLVLDEPMSGLDPLARIGVKNILQQLKAEGATVFYSSHLLADVEAICDRLAVLHEGRLLFTGTLTECLAAGRTDNLEQAYLNLVTAAST